MKRTLTYIVTIVAALGLLISCADLGEIEKRIDSLDSRVTALETVTENLNKNIEALQKLSEAAFIKSVTSNANGYTIELSNGDKLEILNGTEGQGIAPLLRINSEGKWEVNYSGDASNTAAWQLIGSGIPATGENGATPIFGVDADGYWTVRYSETETPVRVKDANGSDVKAVSEGSGDSFFQSVEYDESNNVLNVTVTGGKALSVPVIKDISFVIKGADNKPVTDIVTLSRGENKIYTVEAKGIADASIITRPDGWNASLSMESGMTSGQLEIIAPPATKSGEVIADSRTDISILVLSTKGFAFMAKLKVQLDGETIYEPTASIDENVTATESTLTFIVNTLHTDGYYYKAVKHEGETAPETPSTADLRNGTKETQPSLTISGLDKNSTYTLFVLPVNGDSNGEIKSITAKTEYGEITDYYQAYNDGLDIIIAGETYNKEKNGEAILLIADVENKDLRASIHQKKGIFFLEENDGAYFGTPSITQIKNEVILIGRYTDKKVTVKPGVCMNLVSDKLIMKNIIFDMVNLSSSGNNGYAFNNANSTGHFSKLHFEDCEFIHVQKPIFYASSATYGINSIRVLNSSIQLVATVNTPLFNAYKGTVLEQYIEFIFNNNIVYNENAFPIQIFSYDNNITQTATVWTGQFCMCNNTFYNVPGGNGYLKAYQLSELNVSKNIFWAAPEYTSTGSYVFILYSAEQTGENINITDNIAYGMANNRNWDIAHSNSTYKPGTNRIIKADEDILSVKNTTTGTFTPIEAYKSYGAQR